MGDDACVSDARPVAPKIRRAIATAQRCQVAVTLAAGRMFEVAVPFAQELAISAPLICYQGALVRATCAPAPLFVTLMDTALMREVLEWAASRGWHMALSSQSQAFALRAEHPDVFHRILSQERIVLVDTLPAVLDQHQPVKFIEIDEPGAADEIEAELRDRFEGRMCGRAFAQASRRGKPAGCLEGRGPSPARAPSFCPAGADDGRRRSGQQRLNGCLGGHWRGDGRW